MGDRKEEKFDLPPGYLDRIEMARARFTTDRDQLREQIVYKNGVLAGLELALHMQSISISPIKGFGVELPVGDDVPVVL